MKKIALLIALLTLAACSGSGKGPPRNLDNACSMKSQRPGWFKAMDKTERKWGVPAPVQMATIYHESRFVPNAKTQYRFALGVIPMGRQSSATGYAQAIDSTWDWYKGEAGGFGARRSNFADSVDFIGWYMDKTEKRNGVSKFDMYNQYLAYHDGHTGYARGTYRKKSWLLRVANDAETRAIMYQNQLKGCSG